MGIDEMLAEARRSLHRVRAEDLPQLQGRGAFVVDIRSSGTRSTDGHIPGATVIDRLALEWRLDPSSDSVMQGGPTHEHVVVVVCNEGFASSLAARDLQRLGFVNATDLIGGFRAYADARLPIDANPTREAGYPLGALD